MNEEKTLKGLTEGLFDEFESLIEKTAKVSGFGIKSMLDLDDETATALVGSIKIYNKSKELYVTQAIVLERLVKDLEELKDMNKNLRKQNEMLNENLMKMRYDFNNKS